MSYKKCKVVMLATDKAENCLIADKICRQVFYTTQYLTQSYLQEDYRTSHHLYILSDEDIKEGNYTIDNWGSNKLEYHNNEVFKIEKGSVIGKYAKKIIATTDKSLTYYKKEDIHYRFLPQISHDFITKYIEEYNKGNKIEEVLVEYIWKRDIKAEKFTGVSCGVNNFKISSNNTIFIKPNKDSWNRDEIEDIIDFIIDNAEIRERDLFINNQLLDANQVLNRYLEENK